MTDCAMKLSNLKISRTCSSITRYAKCPVIHKTNKWRAFTSVASSQANAHPKTVGHIDVGEMQPEQDPSTRDEELIGVKVLVATLMVPRRPTQAYTIQALQLLHQCFISWHQASC